MATMKIIAFSSVNTEYRSARDGDVPDRYTTEQRLHASMGRRCGEEAPKVLAPLSLVTRI